MRPRIRIKTVRAGEDVGAGVVPAAAGARAARPRVCGVPVRQKAALPVPEGAARRAGTGL